MIQRIFSSLPGFKEISLHAGLNILLAKRTPGASDRQTRNRAGKSSLIEIIHFLTGSQCDPASIFRSSALEGHSFGMVFDVGASSIEVQRSGATYSKVRLRLLSETQAGWPERGLDLTGAAEVSVASWCEILGEELFGLAKAQGGDLGKYRPTFRSLFPYFVRRQSSQGFISPVQRMEGQLVWDVQVMVSWLLGLDWRIPQELQTLRDRDKSLHTFKKAAGRELDQLVGKLGELRAEVALATERVSRLRNRISEFHMLPEYGDREIELNDATREFNELRNATVSDSALIQQVEASLREERPPAIEDVKHVYEEAGLLLPDAVLRRFEEVAAFHGSVVNNRKMYLHGEVVAAKQRVEQRQRRLLELDRRRGELVQLLRTHGALAELTELQAELGRKEGELETLRKRYAAAERLESEGTRIAVEKKQLLLRLQEDQSERSESIERAIVLVRDITAALYDTPGKLLVEASASGPKVSIKIEGDRSKGVGSMEVFAFDLAVMKLVRERVAGTGFLVHDSHLYDGVDGRQKARALMLAKESAMVQGWQYLVTMNEDDLPQVEDQPEGFTLDDAFVPVSLTDETETGGLFGMRFD